jgi:hypothetical protein
MDLDTFLEKNFSENDATEIKNISKCHSVRDIIKSDFNKIEIDFFINTSNKLLHYKKFELLNRFSESFDTFEVMGTPQKKDRVFNKLVNIYYEATEQSKLLDYFFENISNRMISITPAAAKAEKLSEKFILRRHSGMELYAKYLFYKERYTEAIKVCDDASAQGWRGNWDKWRGKTVEDLKVSATKVKSIAQTGFLGEVKALQQLESLGYKVAQFGKARTRKGMNHVGIHSVPDIHVGLSHINIYQNKLNAKTLIEVTSLDLLENTYPTMLDYSFNDCMELAKICSNKFPCHLYQRDPNIAPCSLGKGMFTPKMLDALKIPTNIGEGLKKCAVIQRCQSRFGAISALNRGKIGEQSISNQFLQDNIRVHRYINNFLLKQVNEGKKVGAYQELKKQGHPGRYDFIAYSTNECVAVEVKANKSKLSYWQEMRLQLMANFGHKILVANVIGDDVKMSSPIFELDLPTNEDFIETLNYYHPSEAGRKGVISDTLITGYK